MEAELCPNKLGAVRSNVSRIHMKVVVNAGWFNKFIEKADDAANTLSVE